MNFKSPSVENLKPDLRSAVNLRLNRALTTKLIRITILGFLDAISVVLAWTVALFYGTPLESLWTKNLSFIVLILIVELGIIALSGLYRAGIHRRNYFELIKAISLSELFLLLIAFLTEPNSYVSRSTFLLFWFLSIVFICMCRLLFDIVTKALRQKGYVRHTVFVISDVEEQESNIKLIEKEKTYTILGVADSSCLDKNNREEIFKYLRQLGVVEAFVSWNAINNRLYVCWHFQTAGISLRILPTERMSILSKSVFGSIGGVPSLTIPAQVITGADFWLKRCFDLYGAITLLIVFAPLFLLIAVLIKLDNPGPVFFKQNRIGLHSQKFKIWKFRTMVANAETLQVDLEAKNVNKDGVLFKMKDDPRITRVGKFLRRYSLDELPQLFNVVLGQMSLVGPRPLPLRDVEKFTTSHFIRQEVLPGLTGLWQVSGRSDIDNFDHVVKLDISYIENWSLWLDIKILLQTVQVVLQKKGAY